MLQCAQRVPSVQSKLIELSELSLLNLLIGLSIFSILSKFSILIVLSGLSKLIVLSGLIISNITAACSACSAGSGS